MKALIPSVKSTVTSPDCREWLPTGFDNALRELDHLSESCGGQDEIPLYRGHANTDWLLDSTFVRKELDMKYGYKAPYPRPLGFHTEVSDALLAKFTRRWRPSDEALAKELSDGIDPDYEMMKHIQQYVKNDIEPRGTFLIDWTVERDIALFFSTYEGNGAARRLRGSAGALWVFYPMATGKILMTMKMRDILVMMSDASFRLNAERTLPLIFHPSKQTAMLRAMAQKPVYVAQMDYRYDLADAWIGTENERGCSVFKKIILSEDVLSDVVRHLDRVGIDESRVYPD